MTPLIFQRGLVLSATFLPDRVRYLVVHPTINVKCPGCGGPGKIEILPHFNGDKIDGYFDLIHCLYGECISNLIPVFSHNTGQGEHAYVDLSPHNFGVKKGDRLEWMTNVCLWTSMGNPTLRTHLRKVGWEKLTGVPTA